MREVQEGLFTVIHDQDLHDHGFRCTHVTDNDHISITIPLTAHGFRTIHLGPRQCIEWGKRLERFGHQILAADPERAGDCRV